MDRELRKIRIGQGLMQALNPSLRRKLPTKTADPGEVKQSLTLRGMDETGILRGTFWEWAARELESSQKAGVSVITYDEESYPERLKNLPDPPPHLYMRGSLTEQDVIAIALVGSRNATRYGLRVAEQLGEELAAAGLTVVSGLARGIDSAAHRGAIRAKGRTIGVLGSGIDIVYPSENVALFDQVAASGAVLTEFPMGMAPLPQNFPSRNRIIAALSGAVVVVEAARDSGSLITAMLAADELGLDVGAVPGPVTSKTSMGCNDLLFAGAGVVRDAEDVVHLLPAAMKAALGRATGIAEGSAGEAQPELPMMIPGLAEGARAILEALDMDEPSSVDEIAGRVKLASGVLLGHLLDLEVRGLAIQLPGGHYVRKF